MKDSKGRAIEEWADIVRRVVGHVSAAETGEKRDKFFAAMSEVMLEREFVPNTLRLVNGGKATANWLPVVFKARFVDGIMEHAKAAATIHQTGGGTGMTENLRPAGVNIGGRALGPVSFMNTSTVTDVVSWGVRVALTWE